MNEGERIPPAVRARLVVKGLTPPYLWAGLKHAKDRLRGAPPAAPAQEEPLSPPEPAPLPEPPEWEWIPEGFARPVGGWNGGAVAESYREKWPSFLAAVDGPGPLGVAHEVPAGEAVPRDDLGAQQTILAFGYVLALAARGGGPVSMLDWGGGLGHYSVLARALVPGIELEYHVKDVPTVASVGRTLVPDGTFHDDDTCLGRRYDLVLASNSLHYSEDWQGTLATLAGATGRFLYVTLLPVALESDSFVVIQRAERYGYGTEYLGWVVNRDELLERAAAAGLELVREILLPAQFAAEGAPEAVTGHRGFLFAAPESE